MKLAIIPARGGSKRIPRKNIKPFCGRPMLAWSIAVARESGCFDQIAVSTDDDEIAEIALECGATVPFRRSAALADDLTPTSAVVRDAIEHLVSEGSSATEVCCIYATAPFMRAEDLRSALGVLNSSGADFVFPVTTFAFPVQRAIRLTAEGRVQMFMPEHFHTRSQDLEQAYHDAGQFYWGTSAAWSGGGSVFADRSVAFVLPRHRVQDIDTTEDWVRAEWMFRALQKEPA